MYSEESQVNFLWTVLQPVVHRDSHYTGQYIYPGFAFKKLSTPITRKYVSFSTWLFNHIISCSKSFTILCDFNLYLKKNIRVNREKSAFISKREDALEINKEFGYLNLVVFIDYHST